LLLSLPSLKREEKFPLKPQLLNPTKLNNSEQNAKWPTDDSLINYELPQCSVVTRMMWRNTGQAEIILWKWN
jgi:hypothetical protein